MGFNVKTIIAEAGEGGTVSGGGDVIKGGSVTLTAAADEGYTFAGWYNGETKASETAEFTVENVTEDKTYTAQFTEDAVVDPDPTPTPTPNPVEPSGFDFATLRTLRTQSIAVDHKTKTIDIDAVRDTDYITVYEYQLDTIPGGTFRMASYMGNNVVYHFDDRTYTITKKDKDSVTVATKITIFGETRYYSFNINFSPVE